MAILNWMVLLKGNKLSDKCKLILFYPPSTNSLFPYHLKFVNYFRTLRNQYMLFWPLKDA